MTSREQQLHELQTFIASTKDSRELKRALAVKMTLSGRRWAEVMEDLGVSHAFISKWRSRYKSNGLSSLLLAYRGSEKYLTGAHRHQVCAWLHQQTHWSPRQLCDYLRNEYGIVYKSRQSYYDILHEAKVSWKKSQPQNPQRDPEDIQGTREAIKKNAGGTAADH